MKPVQNTRGSVVALCAMALFASAANAGAQDTAPVRPYVQIAGLFQPAATAHESHTFPIYVENGSYSVAYRLPSAPVLEVSTGMAFRRHFGWSVAFSGVWSKSSASTAETVPHPFFFNQPRTANGAVSGLSRREAAIHADALVGVPLARTLALDLFGGPTFLFVTQSVVTPEYAEAYPYDSIEAISPARHDQGRSGIGFNAGADLSVRVASRIGVDVVARYVHGSVSLSTADGAQFSMRDAAVRVGAGVRIRF
jgi:hypothetical protein